MAKTVEIGIAVTGSRKTSRTYGKVSNDIAKSNKKIVASSKAVEIQSKKTQKSIVSGVGLQKAALVGLAGFMTGTLGKALIDTQKNIDKINNTLKVAKGTTKAAALEMAFLEKEADRLGLQIVSAATSYAQFSAAAKNSTLTTMQQREVFLGVSEASAAMGLSAADAEGAMRALQQMMSKGTVQAEELRGQLGERIPGAFGLAAKAMGLTEKALGKQLELGKIMAADMLPKLAAEMRKAFGATAARGAETLNGKINILSNSTFRLQRQFLQGGGADLLKKGFDLASKSVDVLGDNLDTVITGFKTLGIVLGSAALITGVTALGKALLKVNPLMAALGATVLGINLALDKMERNAKAVEGAFDPTSKESVDRTREALENLLKMRQLASASTPLTKLVRDPTSSTGSRRITLENKAQKELNKARAEAVKQLGKQITGRSTEAIRLQIEALKKLGTEYKKVEDEILEMSGAEKDLLNVQDSLNKLLLDFKGTKLNFKIEDATKDTIDFQKRIEILQGIAKDFFQEQFSFSPKAKEKAVEALTLAKSLSEQKIQIEQTEADRIKDIAQQLADDKQSILEFSASAASQLTGELSQLATIGIENQIKSIQLADKQANREKSLGEAKTSREKTELKEQFAKEDKIQSLRKKAFDRQQKFAVAQAGMDTAGGIVNALTLKPASLVPFGIGLAIATGATQLAIINKQKFARGGVVQGQTSGDNVPIMANGKERVLTARQNQTFEKLVDGGGGQQVSFGDINISIAGNGDPSVIANAVVQTAQEKIRMFGDTTKRTNSLQVRTI